MVPLGHFDRYWSVIQPTLGQWSKPAEPISITCRDPMVELMALESYVYFRPLPLVLPEITGICREE
jgi:hypothetical protein